MTDHDDSPAERGGPHDARDIAADGAGPACGACGRQGALGAFCGACGAHVGSGKKRPPVPALVSAAIWAAATGGLFAIFLLVPPAQSAGSEPGAADVPPQPETAATGGSALPSEASTPAGQVQPVGGAAGDSADLDTPELGGDEPATSPAPGAEVSGAEAPCAPRSYSASRFLTLSSRESYPISSAFDGDNESAWAVRDAVPGEEWIEMTLSPGTRVSNLWLTTGYEKIHRRSGDLFPLNAHLRRFTVVTDAGRRTIDVVEDQRAADVRLDEVTGQIRIVMEDVWPGERWQDLSISEIRLTCAR